MNNYIETLPKEIKDYFNILSEDYPEFLNNYINTPRMLKQKEISVSCGTYYSKMFNINTWYSSLDHSIAVALIIWHFTHDKKQTLAGLFHDISTPAFKHCIDFMNGDRENQESTEDLTKEMIINSKEIMDLLKKDNISIDEISDYHMYPIADNDTPLLSADRLEYTLSNGLGVIKKLWTLDEVKEIYNNLTIVKNENKIDEMCFKNKEIAEDFVNKMSTLSILYMNEQRRFAMQFLADIMKRLSNKNIITINDLYELSEKEIINIIENSNEDNISTCFNIWKNSNDIKTSNEYIPDKYCININAKKRYINPLVLINNKPVRISEISKESKDNISKCLDYSFDKYLYMDFNFKKSKIKRLHI